MNSPRIDNVSMRDLESKLGADRIEFSSEVRLKMSLTDKFIEVINEIFSLVKMS